MNLMLFGDIHIEEKSIPEIEEIFTELIEIKNKYNIDGVIITGDSFDKVSPSPLELDCFCNFIKELDVPIILISAKSHESISEKISINNHFSILNKKIIVYSEYIDDTHLYVGHFTLAESKYSYGSTVSKNDFKQYIYVVLGHQHSHEVIKPNICHIGSVRYVDFAEAQDKAKYCMIINDYDGEKEKYFFIPLKSPITMINLILEKSND